MNFSVLKQQLPTFHTIDEANALQFESKIKDLLTQNRKLIKQLLLQSPPHSWDSLINPIEHVNNELHKEWSPFSHLHAVRETESLRQLHHRLLPQLTEYHTELAQNKNLFEAIIALAEDQGFEKLNAAQFKTIENEIRDFKLSGVNLPAYKKTRLARLQKQLQQLMTTFSENLLDATEGWSLNITQPERLKGLPEHAKALARDHAIQKKQSGYVLTLDYPLYSAALRFLDDRDLRKCLYEAYVTRASDCGPNRGKWDNTTVMEEIIKIRDEIAKLTGFQTYAHYSLATKMAGHPEEVLQFLQDLLVKSKPIAEQEYQAIRELARQLDELKTVEAWDIPYYSEKLKETTFHFSQEDLRPYFPVHTVLKGLFQIVNKIYGIRVNKESGVDVWHPDVAFFSIYDDKNNLRGGFYIDLFARPHKRDGAWMDECRIRCLLKDNHLQYPIAFLTCNFMPAATTEAALLTHDDVVTLFHEFGHCLQHLLTQVDYPSVSGINGVPWDAVEFPSQFMENFCWEKAALDLIAAHYQTGTPLPLDLYQKMIKAKNFQTGLQMVRQIEFALFDFLLHLNFQSGKKNQISHVLKSVRKQTAVIPVPSYNRFQNSFSHIFAGSYAAGYYSYKWAEVLSADAYAKFQENGLFDPQTGHDFMKNILEVGGVVDPMTAFIAFRGRKPEIDALLKQNGIVA